MTIEDLANIVEIHVPCVECPVRQLCDSIKGDDITCHEIIASIFRKGVEAIEREEKE